MSLRKQLTADVDRATYWRWVGWALFVLLPVDLLTTLLCAAVVGPAAEANPWMAWLLAQPLPVIVGVHVAIGATVVVGFAVYEALSRRSPYGAVMFRSARLYLVLLVAAGSLVFLSNVVVLVYGLTGVGG